MFPRLFSVRTLLKKAVCWVREEERETGKARSVDGALHGGVGNTDSLSEMYI